MANTFDIRFDRAVGLASIFDAPANSLRWKGAGRLSVDAEGISVAVKRSLVSLLVRHRSQRIPAQSIQEVYREGEALRVEFATEENPRAVLPFWTRDRDTAAQIMQLLPTSRTIELEESTRRPAPGNARRALAMAAIAMLALIALFVGFRQKADVGTTAVASAAPDDSAVIAPPEFTAPARAPTDTADERISEDEARKLALMAEDPVDWTSPPPATFPAQAIENPQAPRKERPPVTAPAEPAAEEETEAFVPVEVPPIHVGMSAPVMPIRQGTLAYDAGRSLLRHFEAAASDLNEGYRLERERADTGRLGMDKFADSLEILARRWSDLAVKLLDSREAGDTALTGLRTTLLSVADYQGRFLTGYAAAVRSRSVDAAVIAFEDLKRADEMLEQARQYFR